MNKNVFRDFWTNVVGVDKPKVLNLKKPKSGGRDDFQNMEQQAGAAEEEAARALARAATLEEEVQATEDQAEAAVKDLNLLEGLLDQPPIPPPGGKSAVKEGLFGIPIPPIPPIPDPSITSQSRSLINRTGLCN